MTEQTLEHDRTPENSSSPVTFGSSELRGLIDRIDAGVLDREAADRPPFAEFEWIRQARLGALRLPRPEGGGADLTELFATVIDLAAADPDITHSLRNHFNLLESLIRRPHPSNEWFFERAGRGEIFGISGSDLPYLGTFPQLYLTAVIAGILRRVTRDAVDLVHNKSRTYYHAESDRANDDPILQHTVGLIASQAYAAEALVLTAAIDLQNATAAGGTAAEKDLSLRAAARAAKAKIVVDEIAHRAASDLFDVGGGSAVRRTAHLDRHWRNIRTVAAHNPKTFKARWIGDHEINGTPLPTGAFF